MSRRPRKSSKKQPPPQTRQEGAIRIGRYVRWLYGADTLPATLVELLIDATFDEIAAVEDGETRQRLLREAMDRAYCQLSED